MDESCISETEAGLLLHVILNPQDDGAWRILADYYEETGEEEKRLGAIGHYIPVGEYNWECHGPPFSRLLVMDCAPPSSELVMVYSE